MTYEELIARQKQNGLMGGQPSLFSGFGDHMMGGLETGLMAATGALAEPMAGIAGMFGMASGDTNTDYVNQTRDKLTYKPKSKAVKALFEKATPYAEKAGGWVDNAATGIESYTGIPREAVKAGPLMAAELAGGVGLMGRVGNTLTKNAVSVPRKMGQSGAISKTPRMSRAEAERLGYWHPIGGGKKTAKPFDEYTSTVIDTSNAHPSTILHPEEMLGGVIIPGFGDRTMAGKLLTSVDGVDFENPVQLDGGHGFMKENPAGWASAKPVITKLNNKAIEALDQGKTPYLNYMPMKHETVDFNTMMSDALLEQMKASKITKKAKKEFDKKIRTIRPEWKGIDNPESRAQLDKTGALRQAFVDTAKLDQFKNQGFPDIAGTRKALIDPILMDTPLLHGGQSIARLDGKVIDIPEVPHPTYPSQMGGEYIGGLEQGIPLQLMMPDFIKARRADPLDTGPAYDYRSIDMAKPVQPANQEWLDGLMDYIEKSKEFNPQ